MQPAPRRLIEIVGCHAAQPGQGEGEANRLRRPQGPVPRSGTLVSDHEIGAVVLVADAQRSLNVLAQRDVAGLLDDSGPMVIDLERAVPDQPLFR